MCIDKECFDKYMGSLQIGKKVCLKKKSEGVLKRLLNVYREVTYMSIARR